MGPLLILTAGLLALAVGFGRYVLIPALGMSFHTDIFMVRYGIWMSVGLIAAHGIAGFINNQNSAKEQLVCFLATLVGILALGFVGRTLVDTMSSATYPKDARYWVEAVYWVLSGTLLYGPLSGVLHRHLSRNRQYSAILKRTETVHNRRRAA